MQFEFKSQEGSGMGSSQSDQSLSVIKIRFDIPLEKPSLITGISVYIKDTKIAGQLFEVHKLET